MKYKTVKINPTSEGKWEVVYLKSDGVERKGKTYPHSLGFFHYKETMKDNDAANKLKELMIKRHKEEIKKITLSLNALEKLKI